MRIIDYLMYKALKAAMDPKTDPDMLDFLSEKGWGNVKRAVMFNPNTRRETKDKLEKRYFPTSGEGG